jgi:activator of HSP90 ATPase
MSDRIDFSAPVQTPSRRQAILGVAFAVSGFAVCSGARAADQEITRSAESIHEEPHFNTTRKRLYEALTDPAQFHKVTLLSEAVKSGMAPLSTPTEIAREVGGAFTLFGGYIVGRHLELVPHERIVQAWRAESWGPGAFSIAKFELLEQGSGSKIIFDHTGFPKGQAEHLAEGWKTNYWEPLAKFLA